MSTPPPPDPDAPLTGAARSVNRQGLIIIVWICFTIATLFVSLRLFVRWHQNRRFLADDYWITWAWLCTLTMASALIVCIICSVLTCSPPSNYFHGSCDSPREQWRQSFNVIFSTTVDVATDLMIMALPIAVLPSLQLDKKKKIGLGIAFSLGIIIICVAIVRMSQVIVGKKVDLVGLAIWGAKQQPLLLSVHYQHSKAYLPEASRSMRHRGVVGRIQLITTAEVLNVGGAMAQQ
ncbi:hypothetical protein FOC4_g10000896 [Fusarium odoratissimum]|uniref:Rhodopsin domain-containing protein n=1 Tax=Fusarium oxysporum f. sp. cubense (strain race 4) TaxID=2502994 RepID=N1RWI0_FUSC4|nr:hypothetical protein FOC4_g10000896 [Fusarium odoratissimum]